MIDKIIRVVFVCSYEFLSILQDLVDKLRVPRDGLGNLGLIELFDGFLRIVLRFVKLTLKISEDISTSVQLFGTFLERDNVLGHLLVHICSACKKCFEVL